MPLRFSDQLVREIFKAGARGYVMKSDADRDLAEAVSAVAVGKIYSTVKGTQPAESRTMSRSPASGALPGTLTGCEREAVRTIAQSMRKH